MRRTVIWIAFIGILAAIAGLFALLSRPDVYQDPMIGLTAPTISLETLTRDTARTAIEGDTLINFWATWCAPCLAEHPVLMQLADEGLNVVGVAYRDNPQKITAYLTKAGDPFSTVYLDPKGNTLTAFGVQGVPESFLVGADGKIKARVSGVLDPQTLERELLPALKN